MKYLEFTHEFIGNFRRKDTLTFDSKLHKTIKLTQSTRHLYDSYDTSQKSVFEGLV
jgi:hypothetical protein